MHYLYGLTRWLLIAFGVQYAQFALALRRSKEKKAAKRFFKKAIKSNVIPEKINIDKSGSNAAAIKEYNKEEGANIEIRQNKYLII